MNSLLPSSVLEPRRTQPPVFSAHLEEHWTNWHSWLSIFNEVRTSLKTQNFLCFLLFCFVLFLNEGNSVSLLGSHWHSAWLPARPFSPLWLTLRGFLWLSKSQNICRCLRTSWVCFSRLSDGSVPMPLSRILHPEGWRRFSFAMWHLSQWDLLSTLTSCFNSTWK